jgi:NTE family protein
LIAKITITLIIITGPLLSFAQNMVKIGLVLSGGGARGIAHLGVLKALDELGVTISHISGTSAGAIVGAFYSAGYKPEEILNISKTQKFFGYSNFLFGKAGLFNMDTFEAVYKTYFTRNLIEELPIPMTITATDIVKGEIHYFTHGDLSKALMASSCVPLVFEPVRVENTIMIDGGILNNFPIEPLLPITDKIIGVNVNAISQNFDQIHMKDMLDRGFHIAMKGAIMDKIKYCDVFIEPENMSRFGMFDLSKLDEIFTEGYNCAMDHSKELVKISL